MKPNGFFDILKSEYGINPAGIKNWGKKSITSMWDSIASGSKRATTALQSKGFLSSTPRGFDTEKNPEAGHAEELHRRFANLRYLRLQIVEKKGIFCTSGLWTTSGALKVP